jgi:hypothetical protein
MQGAARRIICSRCRLAYRSTEWPTLELVEVLDSGSVRRVLSDWPASDAIEVRCCRRCGGEMARLAKERALQAAMKESETTRE